MCSYSTAMRVVSSGKGGYLAKLFTVTPEGWLELRKEAA